MAAMTGADVEAAGEALFTAERDRVQTTLISAAHAGMDMDDAYAVQADFVRRKLARRDHPWLEDRPDFESHAICAKHRHS